ncbi:MAG: hypothetical protein J7M03_02695 [Candidatus Desulfofervidaceae bacterium]|nr:hypothetical protein [Candidatus Desulfofervidaceae bacterium]
MVKYMIALPAKQKHPASKLDERFGRANYYYLTDGIKGEFFTNPYLNEPCFSTKNSHGLGLAIVYMLMNAHAGWVHVESKLERGTQFLLYFPVKPAAEC